MTGVIRVLVVDDHPVVRAAIVAVLAEEADIEVVGEAGTAREAVFEARVQRPDVVLLDVTMPGQSGLEIIQPLVHEQPELNVLVLSMEDEPQQVRTALSSGAAGYVLKEATAAQVVEAIRDVAGGGRYLSPQLGIRLLTREEGPADEDPLSSREREVLRLIAFGYTNFEIGLLLSISVRTVEGHRSRIMAALQLRTRAELVRYALERKLLSE